MLFMYFCKDYLNILKFKHRLYFYSNQSVVYYVRSLDPRRNFLKILNQVDTDLKNHQLIIFQLYNYQNISQDHTGTLLV